jgi:hypothetical protein
MLLVLPQFDSLNSQSVLWVQKVHDEGRGDDLQVEEVKGVTHGWTQFPDSWINEEYRSKKLDAFRRAREFLKDIWGLESCGGDGVELTNESEHAGCAASEILDEHSPQSDDHNPKTTTSM